MFNHQLIERTVSLLSSLPLADTKTYRMAACILELTKEICKKETEILILSSKVNEMKDERLHLLQANERLSKMKRPYMRKARAED